MDEIHYWEFRKNGVVLIPPQVASVATKAIRAVQKFGPDPVVFIFLGLVFCITADFVEPRWLIVIMFFLLLGTYCWRRDRVEKHELDMANSRLDAERLKLQGKKDTHRTDGRALQPQLPLNLLPKEEDK